MCVTPVILKKSKLKHTFTDDFTHLQVPCGKCIECRKQRVNSWYVRLENELKRSDTAYFCTFTYDENYLPFTDNLNDTLDYTDLQRMFKRLRKKMAKKTPHKLRYYAVGEYGSTYNRPHYHAIIFNPLSEDDIINEWNDGKGSPLGFVHVGKVESASIYYTLKYTLKSAVNEKDETTDRLPEKALMSKGLGENFLTDEVIRRYRDQPERSMTFLGNKKLPLPRYYRDKIFSGDAEKLKTIRNQRLKIFVDEQTLKRYEPIYGQKQQKRIEREKEKLSRTD